MAICLRGRKRHGILHIKIDYFINRLIENQAASSLPAYTSIPMVMGEQSMKNARHKAARERGFLPCI
jgi:hypothetical protein